MMQSSSPGVITTTDRRAQLREHLQQCRAVTLAQFDTLDYDTFCHQAHRDFSPVGWHLGHIAYIEALWILQRCAGLSPQFPEYQRLFAADGLAKGDRVHLPSLATVWEYLDTVRTQTLNYLQVAPLERQERLWRWLIQHESQHNETITLVLALQQPAPGVTSGGMQPVPVPSEMVKIPAGYFKQGNESVEALDNERLIHQVHLNSYWIDRYPVTCGEYQRFMEADGYEDARWWSPQGWQWLQAHPVRQPLYWTGDRTQINHPVCGVSWYESEAYARFVGKRLPTEAEWEKAASWDTAQQKRTYPWGEAAPTQSHCNHQHFQGKRTPVDAYPAGQSAAGCYDLLGNVWEWTASWFAPYEGFTAYPYPGYSQVYFDEQHRVLRGGSWATGAWTIRNTFRNWYHPGTRQILAGFRCAASRPLA